MNNLLRLSVMSCLLMASQGISGNENLSPEHDGEFYHDPSTTYEVCCDESDNDCCEEEHRGYAGTFRPKVPHHYKIRPRILRPQHYKATICRFETVRSEALDENGCKVVCYHKVPHYYCEERCRLVLDRCCSNDTQYKNECYDHNDRQLAASNNCCGILKFCPPCISSACYEGDFNLDFGYRRDNLQCILDHFDPPGFFLVSDDLKINKIQVQEIGVKGKVIANQCLMLKGYAFTGEIIKANYIETATGNTGLSSTTRMKSNGGQTLDCSIGAGILIPFFQGVRIGPTGGWSYNNQYVKIHKGDAAVLRGLQYNNRWQGAWAGADALLDFCGFGVHAGYEYHFPRWHAAWTLKGDDSPGTYSDVRRSNKGYGNVAFFEAFTNWYECIRFNCQVKFQYWKMRDGSARPAFSNIADVGFGPNEVIKVSRSTWQSFEITAGLGYSF